MLRVANKSIPNNLEWKHHSWKLEKNGIILPFYKGKGSQAAVTASTIAVSLCCLARANCLYMSY